MPVVRDLSHAGVQHENMLGASKNCGGRAEILVVLVFDARLTSESYSIGPSISLPIGT